MASKRAQKIINRLLESEDDPEDVMSASKSELDRIDVKQYDSFEVHPLKEFGQWDLSSWGVFGYNLKGLHELIVYPTRKEAEWAEGLLTDRLAMNHGYDFFNVVSSHGEFSANMDGTVKEWVPTDDDQEGGALLGNIVKFDIDEWERHYGKPMRRLYSIDILDLGYWMKDGSYEGPEHDWRREHRMETE